VNFSDHFNTEEYVLLVITYIIVYVIGIWRGYQHAIFNFEKKNKHRKK
jgi:hypothetical protein